MLGPVKGKEHYIECPKFGGSRAAPACIFFDRYKVCRKRCASLEAHIKAHPEVVNKAVDRKKKGDEKTLFAGRNLPNSKFKCPYCDKVAKSLRGLKTHCTRTHKKKLVVH